MAGKLVRLVPDPEDPDNFAPVPRTPHDRRRAFGKLSLPQQNEMMREIALGEKRCQDIADEFGVSHQYVSKFAKRYAREIAKIQANIEDHLAHLWSVNKANRIAMKQKMALDRFLLPNRTAEDDRTIDAILKNIAEETGQLPPRQNVVTGGVVHRVEGFTTDELTEMLR